MKLKCRINRCDFLTCGTSGVAVLSFCLGMLSGFFLPVEFVVVVETLLLLFLAYLCIFEW